MDEARGTLGRYRLLQRLGVGGMGVVHLAHAQGAAGFEKPVALKILHPRFADDPARMRTLLREAFIGVRIEHDHVVQVLDLGYEDGCYFVAMEYVRGFSLAHVLRHGEQSGEPMPVACALHIARTVADALGYIHALQGPQGPLGLVHGDVSPSNVLLGIEGRIKLSDFGLAAFASETGDRPLGGKPAYLPPEALSGAPSEQSWDVYALGVMLYESLAGRVPYAGTTVHEIQEAIARGAAPLAATRPGAPPALQTVVERAIHRDRSERYPTAAALLVALEQAAPPRIDEVARYRAWIQQRVSAESFASQHGRLPESGGVSAILRITPVLESEEAFTVDLKPAKALRFGVSPALGAKMARRRSEQLLALLGGRLHRELRTVVVADYEGLVEGLVAGELDLAWMPPVPFLQAADRGAGALLVALRQGRPSYDAALVVRAESTIDGLEGLRGGSVAWIDADSASGYVFPAAEIARRFGPLDRFFAAQHFHGSHQAVCEAVLHGWDTVGATYATRDDSGQVVSSGWLDVLGDRAAELRPLAFCGPIPGDNIAHRPDLPAPLIEELTRILSGMQADREGRELLLDVFNADGLAPVDMEAYEPVREMLRLVDRIESSLSALAGDDVLLRILDQDRAS